ncbi:MAG: hypothetical protein BTN85_0781 [Candidatus Methanohalarchaeum thermophilum]|uniref:Uncharacterized protein n=1 Tax=Methanohalarchaeum thermophilum TaxID=1903181 RepID=A0A1Q6DVC0_METT1|nr:MAG: hypothetical protein BTN85_0781 [Candidatus Methanohalarchaeum thermophilum]
MNENTTKITLLLFTIFSVVLVSSFVGSAATDNQIDLEDNEVDLSEYSSNLTDSGNISYIEVSNDSRAFKLDPGLSAEVRNRQNNSVEFKISSQENKTKLIAITISKELVNVSSRGEITVSLDNETITSTNNITNIKSTNENKTEFYPVSINENSSTILVSINEWTSNASTHNLTVESSSGVIGIFSGLKGSFDFSQSFDQPKKLVVLVGLALVIAAVLLSKIE